NIVKSFAIPFQKSAKRAGGSSGRQIPVELGSLYIFYKVCNLQFVLHRVVRLQDLLVSPRKVLFNEQQKPVSSPISPGCKPLASSRSFHQRCDRQRSLPTSRRRCAVIGAAKHMGGVACWNRC